MPATSPTMQAAGGDLAARRIIALARVAIAVVVTAFASVEAIPLPPAATWVAGLVWLPLGAWLWFAEEGPASRARTFVTTVGDLLTASAAMWLLPGQADVVLVLCVPFVAAVAYRSGAVTGLAFAAALFGADTLLGTPPTGSAHLAMHIAQAVAVTGTVLLITRALVVQRRDARSLRQQVRKSDLILAQSAEGMVLTDEAGRVLQANPAAERILGTAGRSLPGTSCHGQDLRTDAGALDCRTGCALLALCEGQDHGVTLYRHVGEQRQPLLASAVPLVDARGRREVLHSFRDITHLKAADEAKTMFLATASHELKTPLTVIRGFTQVLRTVVDEERASMALDAIETRTKELSAIVDRLLLSSRIDAGRVDVVTEPVDVTALLTARLRDVGSSIGRAVEVEADPGLVAEASAEALCTVVDHLVDNAAKYSPGGGAITVRARSTDDHVTIEVSDHGIGMTPEQADRCFDRFWQAEGTDVRRFGGTGIGLYIVRSLVTGMDGHVDVRSALGRGSTFRLTLQAAVPAPARVPGLAHLAERTTVDEFMHQLGLPAGGTS